MASELEKKPVPEASVKGRRWLDIAEVRMVLYVVPMGILLAIIGYLLSR